MDPTDDKQLWELLGKTAEAQVSPFFSRNVMRALRDQPPRRSWIAWLSPRVAVPLASCAVVLIAAAIALHQPALSSRETPNNSTLVKADADDSDLAADLDDLVGDDDTSGADSTII